MLSAIDFSTVEVWTKRGLVTFCLQFVMGLKTRRVHFADCTPNPHETWMKQIAKKLTDCKDGFLIGKRYTLIDWNSEFCRVFHNIVDDTGVRPVPLPPRSPILNTHLERFFGSLRSECLDSLIVFGERALPQAIARYLEHYQAKRNHQGLNNQVIKPGDDVGRIENCRGFRMPRMTVWHAPLQLPPGGLRDVRRFERVKLYQPHHGSRPQPVGLREPSPRVDANSAALVAESPIRFTGICWA